MAVRFALVLALLGLLSGVAPLAAQQDTIVPPGVRVAFPPPGSLVLRVPPALRPGGVWGTRSPPVIAARRWEQATSDLLRQARVDRAHQRLLVGLGLSAPPRAARPRRAIDIPRPEDLAEPSEREPSPPEVIQAMERYADLGLDMRARLELKMDRLRNERCTAADVNDPALGCQGGFPTPSFDQQFLVRAGGIVGDRVHVNVDFDTEREFSTNNNINVFYQGLEDEILRRIEVGNVTFRTPASRFITAGVPANSFGIQAEAQAGPLEFRTILAQQKGSAVRTREFTIGDQTTQPVEFDIRDIDFEQARFFFVVSPQQFPSYPDVDVLNLNRDTLPADLQVAEARVYRLRAQGGQVVSNPNLGGIDAIAVRDDSPQRVGPFSWELLVEGQDYYIDPSGTWFALASRLGSDDFLAVSYVTLGGDTVGTYPAVNRGLDTLRLIHEPRRGLEVPTALHEMRNVYRLAGQDVERATVDLGIRVGTSETPLDAVGTYLSRLGLATSTDATAFDEFNRMFPRLRDPGGGAPVREVFVVFPHLQPFADSSRLQVGERNDSLYRTPTFLLRSQGPAPKAVLNVRYEATGAGSRSSLSLGTIQVRAGSERLYAGNRLLERGRDYEIDYGLGQVTFLNPDGLFPGIGRVRAEFEENQLFDDAPKTLMGFSTTYDLRRVGSISAVGLFQRERTISTRPTLGFEPEAGFIGGVSTDLSFRSDALTRALDGLPFVNTSVPSSLQINGELAMSVPNANRTGAAYIEDFDSESAFTIPLTERLFQHGSRPSSGIGLPATHLGPLGEFALDDAVPLVWQNLVQSGTGVVQFGPRDIDSTIALVGTGFNVETVLWLTLQPDTVGGYPDPLTGRPRWVRPRTPGPRWRSVTQPLGGGSGLGVDLSRVEFMEFWVLEDGDRSAQAENAYLVFDFGTVFEDAVAFAPQSFRASGADTTFSGFRFVGADRLDTEKDSLTNVFNARLDDLGILGDRPDSLVDELTGAVLERVSRCDLRGLSGLTAFPLGDLDARCTSGNGFLDTEDLDGDNRLDRNVGRSTEEFARYVFPIGNDAFFVRDGVSHVDNTGRTRTWRLYRIPFRDQTAVEGQPNLRQVEAMRITMVSPDQGVPGAERAIWLALARMRLVGAPWVKRAATPIPGLSGSVGVPRGEVTASIVTTENTDLGYVPPPGVTNLPPSADVGLGVGTVEINEKSLRLLASEVAVGERAEAFIRFAGEADRNFLNYRQLRVWARGRGPGWNEGDLDFYIKVGRDEHNFYLYRAPARTDTWEPEVVVDLERWLALRGQVESAWLRGDPPSGSAACGGDSTAYVGCDGPYVVHVRDPATSPPSLAAVSEVAVGLLRTQETILIGEAELWVDDIRLVGVIDDRGIAAALDVRLAAADVAEVNLSFTRRDENFRQLGENPPYVTDAATRIGTLLRIDKFLPESWGLQIPLTLQYQRTSADPFYVNGTDLRADALPGLRRPRGSGTLLSLGVRRVRRGEGFFQRTFVDPWSFAMSRENTENVGSLNAVTSRRRLYRLQYDNTAGPRTVGGAPRFLVNLIDALPDWIKNSEFGKGLRTSRLRWNPVRVSFSSTLTNNVAERFVYRVPVELAADSSLRPLRSIVQLWRNAAGVDFRPYSSLSLSVNYSTTRDLQDYGDTTTVARLLRLERRELAGTDIGFERERTLSTALSFAPPVSSWLRPRLLWTTGFNFNRNPNRSDPVRVEGDTSGAFRVPETIANSQRREVGAAVDLARLVRGLAGDSSLVTRLFRGLLPTDLSHARDLRSGFDRVPFEADLRYHLAWGGLDEFRSQEGLPATSAGETKTTVVSGGARLPLSVQVRVSFRDIVNTRWQRRGDDQTQVQQLTREWPSISLTWGYTPPPSIRRVLSSVTAQAQYRVQESARIQPSLAELAGGLGAPVRTENNTTLFAPSLTVGWWSGITTSTRVTLSSSEAVTSGNRTESDRQEWATTLNFAFRPPERLLRMQNRIQTTVAYSASVLSVCLLRADSDECRSVSDSRRNQFDVRLDTGFSATVRGGLTFSYIRSEQRHLSQGLNQIVFTVFGELTLQAGQIR